LTEFFVALARTHQYEVFDLIIGKFSLAENRIEKLRCASDRNLEADGRLGARSRRPSIATGAARDATHLRGFGAFHSVISAGIFFRGTVAKKRVAICQTFLAGFLIDRGALRLVERSLIPVHAQPFQAFNDSGDQFGLVPLGVGVLDSQNHRAALAPRKQPIKQRRARAAYVEIASRGGRKSNANGAL